MTRGPWCEILHALRLEDHAGMRGQGLRRLDWHGLVLIERGRGIYEDGSGAVCPVTVGDAIVLRPGNVHRYEPAPGTRWNELVVLWRGPAFAGWAAAGIPPADAAIVRGLPRSWAQAQFGRIRSALPDRAAAAGHLLVLLAALARTGARSDVAWADAAAAALARRPLRTPQACATAMGMGYHAFRKRCARALGAGPAAVQRRMSLDHAAARLVHGAITLAAAAEEAGFADVAAFSRAFRRQFGSAPGGYRAGLR